MSGFDVELSGPDVCTNSARGAGTASGSVHPCNGSGFVLVGINYWIGCARQTHVPFGPGTATPLCETPSLSVITLVTPPAGIGCPIAKGGPILVTFTALVCDGAAPPPCAQLGVGEPDWLLCTGGAAAGGCCTGCARRTTGGWFGVRIFLFGSTLGGSIPSA